ncbi:MAG: plastocyanin/azurin family copper-binding protein [Halolamina sp.]
MENDALSRRAFLRAGTASAAAAGTAGTAAAQEGTETGTESGGGPTETVAVGPGGSLVFEPEDLTIEAGTTVNWVWESNNHNIVVDSQPEGANWEGTPGDASTTYDTGYEYSHTFETLGTYEYACEPHRSAGMVGSVEVVENIETPEPTGPAVPDSAKSLIVATTFAMIATLVLAFFFLKFGGTSPDAEAE